MKQLAKNNASFVSGGVTHPAEIEVKALIQVIKDYFGL